MSLILQQTDGASADPVGAFGTGLGTPSSSFSKAATVGGTPGTGSNTVGNSSSTSSPAFGFMFEAASSQVGSLSFPLGELWTCNFDALTISANVTWDSLYFIRINSSGVAQQTIASVTGLAQALSLGTNSTLSLSGASVNFGATDRLVVLFGFNWSALGVFTVKPDLAITVVAAPTNPPTAQPSQHFDPIPDYNAAWWQISQYQPRVLPPNYIPTPPPPAQPSQRFDPPFDAAASWVPWQPPRPNKQFLTLLIPPAPVQPSQRFDPLPDHNGVWWQPAPPPVRALPSVLARPSPHQPDQRFDAAAPADFHWWETPVKTPPPVATASLVPRRQADQRFDAMPTLDSVWWARPAEIIPSSGGQVTRQPDQRFDAPPAFDAVWWTPAAKIPLTSGSRITRQPVQRFDAAPPTDWLWWEAQARAIPPDPAQPNRPTAAPFPVAADPGFFWWTPARSFPGAPGGAPAASRQPDQRFNAPPDGNAIWWQTYPRQILAPQPAPMRQPDQRFDAMPAPDFTAWLQIRPRQMPVAAPVLLRQPDQRFNHAVDLGGVWWTPLARALPPTASPVPRHQPDQRFDALPDFNYIWWQRPTLLLMPTLLILGPPRFGNRGAYLPGGYNLGGSTKGAK